MEGHRQKNHDGKPETKATGRRPILKPKADRETNPAGFSFEGEKFLIRRVGDTGYPDVTIGI